MNHPICSATIAPILTYHQPQSAPIQYPKALGENFYDRVTTPPSTYLFNQKPLCLLFKNVFNTISYVWNRYSGCLACLQDPFAHIVWRGVTLTYHHMNRLTIRRNGVKFTVNKTESQKEGYHLDNTHEMVDLPIEIWFNIASFLPKEDILRLMSLNSVFFYTAMDTRYRGITIPTNTGSESRHLLRRLLDPFIATRVRHLSLVLYAKPQSMVPNPGRFMYLRSQVQQTTTDTLMFFRVRNQRPLNHSPTPDFEDILGEFVACSSGFANINGITIKMWYMPRTYNLSAIFASIWSAFGSKLQKLCLEGNLEHYHILVNSKPTLTELKELRIDFDRYSFGQGQDPALKDIVSFINSVGPHLEVLRLRSWFALDISDLFAPLVVFPKLAHLEANLTFVSCRDPIGLSNFIYHLSHTIRKLNLRINPSQSFLNSASSHLPCSGWFLACDEDQCFSQLRIIDIYLGPTTFWNGLMDLVIIFIRRAAHTIEEIGIHERKLDDDDAKSIIDSLSHCISLTSLSLNVENMSIELVDQLASSVPGLKRLWISVGEIIDHSEVEGPSATFLQELETRSYSNWKLEDLSVMQSTLRLRKVEHDIMLAFSRSIPSLFSFFGNGHMDAPATGNYSFDSI